MKDKEKIIKTLRDFGTLPTGRLAAIVGMNYHKAVNLLQVMWEEGTIKGDVQSNQTLWTLKTKKEGSKPNKAETPSSSKKEEHPEWY